MTCANGCRLQGLLLCVLLGAQLLLSNVFACTLIDKGTERGWKQALAASDEVFVARLGKFQEARPPLGAGPYFLNQARYELVEVIKGRPDPSGVLSEGNPYRPVEPQEYVLACGPFLLHPGREGATALVFVKRERLQGGEVLWVNDYSELIKPADPQGQKMLVTVRALQPSGGGKP